MDIIKDIINISEALQEKKLAKIAEEIASRKGECICNFLEMLRRCVITVYIEIDNVSAIALLVIPFTTQPMISFSLALKASCSEDSSSGSLTASLILLQIVSMSSLIEIVVS